MAKRRQPLAPTPIVPPVPQTAWQHVKSWFLYSETIFIARMEATFGLVMVAGGAMDWSPLLSMDISTGFNKAQVLWLGGLSFFKGLVTEIARRRNAVDL